MDFAQFIELVKVLVLPLLYFMLREIRLLAVAMHKLDLRVNTLEVMAGVRKPRTHSSSLAPE